MIPKYLKIKGLYSYQKEQEIHFDNLTAASLFGIFGAVGSGKSSILEAITFALYGDTERLNKSGDDRTYNMMNLRSDELWIDFECIAGKNGDHYKFTVKGKRNSRNFKEVKTFERRGYIRKEDNWTPLAELDSTESIIGLSYDNFRRTIIIPQGRFQEFIELKDAERTRMMKELFQLEKYDLSRKVGALSKQNDIDLSNIDGQLIGLGEVTTDMIEHEEKKLEETRLLIRQFNDRLLALTANLDRVERLKQVFDKVTLLEKELGSLESKRPEMHEREEALRIFEICSLHFKTPFEQKKSLLGSIERNRMVFEKNATRGHELEMLIKKEKEVLTSLHEQYEKREELLDLVQELEKVIDIRDHQIQIERHKSSLQRGEEKLAEKKEAIALLKSEKISKESATEQLKAQLTDINELSLVKSWFATFDEIEENRKRILKEAEDLQKEVVTVRENLNQKIQEANTAFGLSIEADSGLATVLEAVNHFLDKNEAERVNLDNHTIAFQTRLALQKFATELVDGKPCPLCGADHHPSVLHTDDTLPKEIDANDRRKNHLQKLDNSVRKFQLLAEKSFAQMEYLESQKGIIKARYMDTKARLGKHDTEFVWQKFDKKDRQGFEVYFATVEKIQSTIKENELLIKNTGLKIDAETLELDEKLEKPITHLRNEILKADSTILTLTNQLTKVKLADFDGQDKSAISDKIVGLKNSHKQIKELYEKTEKEIDVLEKEQNTITGSQKTLSETIETNRNELIGIQSQIDNQLNTYGFGSENMVVEILQKNISISAERKLIEEFKTALNNTKRDLENLKQQNQGQDYDAGQHDLLSREKEGLDSQLNAMRNEEGQLEGALKKMKENLARKALLLKEKDRLKIRKDHLDDLARLFRSSGFVDYASSIYLQNLIQAANHRFHQMTHQQLHLELGEGNSFWVRDLLNGGHMRLLKTLSGGQKFQAALSLALALADHIHIRNESKHNFFFLDEGFGSLDKNALQTVFETLKSLRKENRIVGIISHVEELQQEIQTYLRIEESEEGSKIVSSWG